jgi:hypothetical protein
MRYIKIKSLFINLKRKEPMKDII